MDKIGKCVKKWLFWQLHVQLSGELWVLVRQQIHKQLYWQIQERLYWQSKPQIFELLQQLWQFEEITNERRK